MTIQGDSVNRLLKFTQNLNALRSEHESIAGAYYSLRVAVEGVLKNEENALATLAIIAEVLDRSFGKESNA